MSLRSSCQAVVLTEGQALCQAPLRNWVKPTTTPRTDLLFHLWKLA